MLIQRALLGSIPSRASLWQRGDSSCCPSHSWSSSARPEAADVLAQKPERAPGFWGGNGFNARLEPGGPLCRVLVLPSLPLSFLSLVHLSGLSRKAPALAAGTAVRGF